MLVVFFQPTSNIRSPRTTTQSRRSNNPFHFALDFARQGPIRPSQTPPNPRCSTSVGKRKPPEILGFPAVPLVEASQG